MNTLTAFTELASLSLAAVRKTPFEATITASYTARNGVVVEGTCPMCGEYVCVSNDIHTVCRCKRRWSVHLIGTLADVDGNDA